MMRAAIYARCSSDNQNVESIHAQLRACRDYCQQQGYVIVKEYADEEQTGRSVNQREFQRMMADGRSKVFEVLVCHKISRFARNAYDNAIHKKSLLNAGVRVEFAAQTIEDYKEGRLMESLLVGFAQYVSENLAKEVLKGMNEKAYKARHNGGKPALGYDVAADGTYVVNESEATLVRKIFEMSASGLGYSKIIDDLQRSGLRTKTGGLFGKNSLHDILRNKKYVGIYTWGRVTVGGIPAIVSQELWDQVQQILDRSKKARGNQQKTQWTLP